MDASFFSHPGFIGGMFGCVAGLIGGGIGFYFSWRNAASWRERKAMLVFALLILLGTTAFVLVQILGSGTAKMIAWIVYGVVFWPALFFSIRLLNRLHQEGLLDNSRGIHGQGDGQTGR